MSKFHVGGAVESAAGSGFSFTFPQVECPRLAIRNVRQSNDGQRIQRLQITFYLVAFVRCCLPWVIPSTMFWLTVTGVEVLARATAAAANFGPTMILRLARLLGLWS